MQNFTVHMGSATPLSSRASPRVPALSTAPADRPASPVSDTAARHCAAAHPSAPSLPAQCRARAAAGRRPPIGGRPHGTPAPHGTPPPHAQDPHFFPPLSPLLRCRRAARAAPLVLPSPLLFDPSSRAPELPHRSPHLDRHLRPPAAPSPSRISAKHCRRPPLPGELLPELPIPEISCKSLTPSPLLSYRASTPPPATTGAPSPPTNTAARRHLHRLTVDPPFRCAPALSSLPGSFPVTTSRSPATPCAVEPPPSRRRARHRTVPRAARALQQVEQAGCPAGLGCQVVAQSAFRMTAHGRPPCPVGSSLGPVSAQYCDGDFKCFFNCFKSQKLVQIPKFVETCRKV
jgi:hypothetical protein